ncbi:MAG: hypothetical protein IPK22_17865 [Verrucomicrobiaceae bacterium]|nr:hypothetical protein [Verrucomicrobiaceae bacterium]
MNTFRRFTRRAWLLHGYLLASMILWPVPTVRSYWTWNTATNAKVEIENPPVGDSWWDDDSDSDGMTNAQEVAFLSDPYNRDSDHDGLTDTDERDITPAMLGGAITTDPWNWDSNANGHSDHDEYWAWQSGLTLNVSYYGQTPPSPLPPDYYRDLDGDGTYNLWDYAPTDSSVSSPPADPGSGTGTPPDPTTTDSDGDTHYDSSDSHPSLNYLWEDWNYNGTNDSQEPPPPSDSDGDTHFDTSDSHPYDPSLWEDWNWNGTNDSQEIPPTNPTDPTSPPDPYYTNSDGDSAMDANDSDPTNPSLWEDWNRNSINDSAEPPDADGDGVTDADEYTAGTNPYFHDSDGDGLSDSEERTAQTNPLLVDTDADGLTDHEEIFIYQKNPLLSRSLPGQQQIDYYQVNLVDTDLDGIPDLVEAWYGRDPSSDADAASDLDVDGHSDLDAYLAGWAFNVSFTSYDQDRDGITDARESYWGFNPYDPDDATQDADHDGLLNMEEIRLGLDPLSATTHGTPDLTYANTTWSLGWKACLNPGSSATTLDDDTDGDGMPDHWEHRHRLDLRDARDAIRDPDKDTLSNLTEYRFLSHPRIPKSESNTHDRSRLYATGKPLNASTAGGLMNRYRAQIAAESAAPQNVFKEFSFAAFAAWEWPDDPSNVPDNGNPIPQCPCGRKDCEACEGNGYCYGCGGSGTLPCAGGHTTSCPTEVRGPCLGHGKRRCSSTHSGPCDGKHGYKPGRKFDCSEHEHKPACEGDACEELEHSHEDSECSQDGEGNWSCGQAGHSHTPGVCDRQVKKCGFADHEHDSDPDSSCYVDDPSNPVPITCQEEGCQNLKQYSCSDDECVIAPCPGPEECDKWENEQCPTCKGKGEQSRSCSESCQSRDCPDCSDGSCIWCSGTGEDNHCSCGDSTCYCLGNDPDCPKIPEVSPPADPPPEIPYREKLKRTLSISDAAGPRYRKVGLNGLPIPDSKPQVQDESGESEEETYIDAFTRQLRHSVSDVYVHAEGSQLPLMVRRDASSEMWTAQSFESPETRPYLPFGAAWSSNICSYIRFDTECVDRDNSVEITNHMGVTLSVPIEDVSPEAQIDMAINGGLNSFDRVTTATVVDEMGSSQKYLPSAGGWIHSTEEVSDAKTSKNVFTGNVLIKKYGTTCYYEPTGISQVLGEIATPNPYVEQTNEPKKSPNIVNYARLKEVHDRHGNRLIYHYPFSNTLIPDLIYDPDRPGHSIQLVQQGGRVIQLRGPDGTTICYEYDGSCLKKVFRKVPPGQPESASVLYDYEQESRLDINSYNEAMKAMSQYELGDPRGMKAAKRIDIENHINLRGITDELGRQYIFHRAYADQDPEKPFSQAEELALKGVFPSFQGGQVQGRQEMINQFNGMTGGAFASYISPGGYSGLGGFGGGTVSSGTEYEVSMKKPRVVIAVTSPLGTTKIRSQQQQLQQLDWAAQAGRLPFDELKALALAAKSSGTAKVVNTFKALDGSVSTYTFSDPHVHSGSDHAVAIAPGYQPLPGLGLNSRSSHNITQTISYCALVIELHKDAELLSSESYAFNSDASMALASATDLSGNTTTFTYGTDGYDDPLTETSYLQQTTGPAIPVTKRFTYDDATRIMTSMTDPMGVRTEYSIETKDILLDSDGDGTGDLPFTVQGLKTAEKVFKGNTLLRETRYSYDHPKFAGLVTKQWTISPNEDVLPSSVTLTTLGDPHDGGTDTNPGWWREVTTTTGPATDAGGLDTSSPSAFSSTYSAADFAGRKRSVVDPRGLMTFFDYDGAGRLTRVYHPDGSAKALGYDAHGNLTSESDGTFTGTTLQSATFTPIRTTFHRYDALNRRIKTALDLNANGLPDWDAADYGTGDHSYTLTGSTRGTATSPPFYDGDLVTTTTYNNRNQVTSQTDPRGSHSTNEYDDAGRLIRTMKNGLETTFTYDGLNNGGSIFDTSAIKPNRTVDPRGVVTTVVYDSLYRPVSSTVSDPGLEGGPMFTAVTLTEYDLSGKPTKVTDPLGRVTLNEYDDLGNLIQVTEPDLTTDTSDNPTVQSFYTHHGKPWKVIDQMGNETITRYDALGRPVEVQGPELNVEGSTLNVGSSSSLRAITTTEYDAAGNVIAVTDPLGRVVETVYDERNRPTHVYAPTMWDAVSGQFVRPYAETTYDALGQPLSVTDHTGATTTNHYDPAGRKWKVEAPALLTSNVSPPATVRPTTLTYFDPGGLPVTVTNPLGQTITNTYDIHGRLTSTLDAEGILNEFDYDAAGNRTLVKDGLNQETTFAYDGLNRLIRQTFANGDTWTHGYNAVQKIAQISPPRHHHSLHLRRSRPPPHRRHQRHGGRDCIPAHFPLLHLRQRRQAPHRH